MFSYLLSSGQKKNSVFWTLGLCFMLYFFIHSAISISYIQSSMFSIPMTKSMIKLHCLQSCCKVKCECIWDVNVFLVVIDFLESVV